MSKTRKILFGILGIVIICCIGFFTFFQESKIPVVQGSNAQEYTQKIAMNSPIKIYFSQSMNEEETESAFQIAPKIPGKITWENSKTLVFTPNERFEIGERYYVTISDKALSAKGKNILGVYREEFVIIGPPQVIFASPWNKEEHILNKHEGEENRDIQNTVESTENNNDDEQELLYPVVNTDQIITVTLDRPIRPLSILDEQDPEILREFVTFEPEIQGDFSWLGTTSFQFRPKSLPMGTVFTAKVASGIQTLDGGVTEEDFVWHFETPEVYIENFEAYNEGDNIDNLDTNFEYWNPQKGFLITFNQDVELEDVQKSLKIYPSNDLEGSTFDDDGFFNGEFTYYTIQGFIESEKIKNKIIVKPTPQLEKETEYKIVFEPGIASSEGEKTMSASYEYEFSTLATPEFISMEQSNDEYASANDVLIKFNNPVLSEELSNYIDILPKNEESTPDCCRMGKDETEWIFNMNYEPSTDYTITIKSGLTDKSGQEIQNLPQSYTFKTEKISPYMGLLSKGNKGVFDVNYPVEFYMKHVNINQFNVSYCDFDIYEFIRLDANYDLYSKNCNNPISWTKTLENNNLNTYETSTIDLDERFGELKQGVHFIDFYSDEYREYWGEKNPYHYKQAFLITDMAIVLKNTEKEAHIWVTDFIDGKPIASVNIDVVNSEGVSIATGQTDQNGLLTLEQEFPDRIYIVARKDDRVSLTSNLWTNGIAPWDFGLDSGKSFNDRNYVFSYTDRPIYRPSDTVHFKGIVRKDNLGAFELPTFEKVTATVQDTEYNEVYKEELQLNENGTFAGKFTLSDTSPVGQYWLEIQIPNEEYYGYSSRKFWVEEYKKPEFTAEISTEKEEFIQGESAEINITGKYFFGAPLKNEKLEWKIIEEDYYFQEYNGPWYNFADLDYYYSCFWYCDPEQTIVASGEGQLNEEGVFTIVQEVTLSEKNSSKLWTLEATINLPSGETTTKRVTLPVHKGEYYIGSKSIDYVYNSDQDIGFKYITVDPQGAPLPGKDLVAGLYKLNWNTVQKQDVDGDFYYESEISEELIEEKSVETDSRGEGTVFFNQVDKPGNYKMKIQGSDTNGNAITSGTEVYVTNENAGSYGRNNNNDKIRLTPDKREYNVGDVAKIVIDNPFSQEVSALITLERDSAIQKEVTTLSQGNSVYEVEITEEMIPNIFASVVLAKGSGEGGEKNKLLLEFNRQKQQVENIDGQIIELENSEEGNRKRILISRLAKEKKDIEANIEKLKDTLQVLRENKEIEPLEIAEITNTKPEFKLGYTTLSVNRAQKELQIEITTEKETYLPGEEIEIQVVTKDNNNNAVPAEVSIAVVDQSILALKSLGDVNLIDFFYGKKGLNITTSSNMVWFMDRVDLKAAKGAKGGGGSGDLEQKKRGNFKDTAFWNAQLQTNENGNGKVKFTLPDNTTSWQILVLGATKDSKVGAEKAEFYTKKKQFVQPILPRFSIEGDEVYVWSRVQNQTENNKEYRIELNGKNFEFIGKQEEKYVDVPANNNKVIGWKIRAKMEDIKEKSDMKFNFTLKTPEGKILDSIEKYIPIKTYSIPEVIAISGKTDDSAYEQIILSNSIQNKLGYMKVQIDNSIIQSFINSYDTLVEYAYGCSEQIMSKTLSAVTLKELETVMQKNDGILLQKEKLAQTVQQTIQKEYEYQNLDGGFGFWKSSDSHPYTSAYVLYGLHTIEQAGFQVDNTVMEKAKQYVKNILGNSIQENNEVSIDVKVFMLWVLAEIGEVNEGYANVFFEDLENLSLFARAHLLMIFDTIAENSSGVKKTTALNKISRINFTITSKVVQEDRTAFFEEEVQNFEALNTDTKTTAVILLALLRTDAENPLLPKIVQYLQNSLFNSGEMVNTQDIIWISLAFKEYITVNKDSESNYIAKTFLNSQEIMNASFKGIHSEDPDSEAVIEIDNLIPGLNEIRFKKEGTGNLYYNIITKYFLPVENIPPRSEGIEIVREYYHLDDTKHTNQLTEFEQGEIYKGKITVIVPKVRQNVIVEEFLPAGFEAINFNLDNTEQSLKEKLYVETKETLGVNYYSPEWNFDHKEIRDDRVVLFSSKLLPGIYEYEFLVRAASAGTFHHLPAQVAEMYNPEIFGRSRGEWIEVKIGNNI